MTERPDGHAKQRTSNITRIASIGAIAVAVVFSLGACGSNATTAGPGAQPSGGAAPVAPELNPVGDIPDAQVYVPFTVPDGSFTLSIPEGWAQTVDGTAVTFTDKLNTVRLDARPAAAAPTPDSVTRDEMQSVQTTNAGFAVELVTRRAGDAVLVTYEVASAPNPVAGRAGTDAVERYSFWRAGHEVVLTLSGPVGADNVDPWRTITDSLQWH